MLTSFIRNRKGVTAIELAMVLPFFILLCFGTIEVALINFRRMILATAAEDVANYFRMVRVQDRAYVAQDQREVACKTLKAANMLCDSGILKIALYRADDPILNPIQIPDIVDNTINPEGGSAGQYIVVLGYETPPILPTSRILMNNNGNRYQIQVRTFVVAAERIIE